VTVITATYNRAATLRLALESLLGQEFRDFEAIIIGDGCTDNSEEVVRSFHDRRLRWSHLERNSGSQAAPNNHGLRLARGR
jgi:glycosyltransferase involved in cell wall biosynthesis